MTISVCDGVSIVIPFGSTENGLPFGIQIISKKNSDIDLLDIAFSLENSFKDIPPLNFDDTNYDFKS